jgi:hypothetical protein
MRVFRIDCAFIYCLPLAPSFITYLFYDHLQSSLAQATPTWDNLLRPH